MEPDSNTKDVPTSELLAKTHAALVQDLRTLSETLGVCSRDSLAAVRNQLDATRAHITEHFRIEENNGYVDVVRQREPRLDYPIRRLADEHRELTQSLDGLIGEADTVASRCERLGEDIRAWMIRVRRHETEEDDLLQDAFNSDIGTAD